MMPCITEPDCDYERRRETERRKTAAILCGLITAHGTQLFEAVDWDEVGVTRKWAEDWWRRHQKMDELRRKLERDHAALIAEYGTPTGDTK